MSDQQQPQQQPASAQRVWTVPCFLRDRETGQFVRTEDTHDLIYDAQGVAAAYFEAQAILRRPGGILQIGTKREEVEPGRVETTALLFRWHQFAPLLKDGTDEMPPIEAVGAEPEPEPAAS